MSVRTLTSGSAAGHRLVCVCVCVTHPGALTGDALDKCVATTSSLSRAFLLDNTIVTIILDIYRRTAWMVCAAGRYRGTNCM